MNQNKYIYVILLLSPFFIQYRVCIIVNPHLLKWCNSQYKFTEKLNANVNIGHDTPPSPKVF